MIQQINLEQLTQKNANKNKPSLQSACNTKPNNSQPIAFV